MAEDKAAQWQWVLTPQLIADDTLPQQALQAALPQRPKAGRNQLGRQNTGPDQPTGPSPFLPDPPG
jgi:hypothetical protein